MTTNENNEVIQSNNNVNNNETNQSNGNDNNVNNNKPRNRHFNNRNRFNRNRFNRNNNQHHNNQQHNNQHHNNQHNNNQHHNNQHHNNQHNNRKNMRQHRRPHKLKNTTDFKPNHNIAELRIINAPTSMVKYSKNIYPRDVILVNDLFGDYQDLTLYNKLLEEIRNTEGGEEGVFKLWHGDNHLIADDKKNWKDTCPTFGFVIERIREYFNMDIKATRFNWYRNSEEWKPFHHDASAIDPKKAAKQNFTVGVSFGLTRDIAFQDVESNKVVTIPLLNGQTYAFTRDINIEWKHGVPQLPPEKKSENGRISIIAWGHVAHKEFPQRKQQQNQQQNQ